MNDEVADDMVKTLAEKYAPRIAGYIPIQTGAPPQAARPKFAPGATQDIDSYEYARLSFAMNAVNACLALRGQARFSVQDAEALVGIKSWLDWQYIREKESK